MSDINELAASAELGEEARNFISSDLGKLVIGLARQEVERAKEKLLLVSATDPEAIRKLQMDARFGEQFERWLVETIQDAEQSLIAFRQQQRGES